MKGERDEDGLLDGLLVWIIFEQVGFGRRGGFIYCCARAEYDESG